MATSTLSEWIQEKENSAYRTPLYYRNGMLIVHREYGMPDDLTRFPFYNVFVKNREMFDPIKLQMDFDPIYHYKPKKMSWDLYNDISLWHILLVLNKCRNEVDFVGEKVWYLDPMAISKYMSRMFVDEKIDTTVF